MSTAGIQALLIQTLTEPTAAARHLLQMTFRRQWLWMALALMCVLNAIVYSLALQINPPDPAAMQMIPAAFRSPMLFTIFLFGALVITIHVLTWIGQMMGGQGQLRDLLILLTWMQMLRLVFQAAVLVVSLVSFSLSALVVFAGSVWALYILACFLNEGHKFDNIPKAVGLIVLTLLAIVVGGSLIAGVIGAVILGGTGNV